MRIAEYEASCNFQLRLQLKIFNYEEKPTKHCHFSLDNRIMYDFLCALLPNFTLLNNLGHLVQGLIKVTATVLTLCKLVFLNRCSKDYLYQTHLGMLFKT